MPALNPRDTLAAIAALYGYDPAAVVSVNITPLEAVIRFRLGNATPGRFTLVDSGFLMTDGTRALLYGMAAAYGYDPTTVVGVRIEQHKSVIRYLTPLSDGVRSTVQADVYVIPEPPFPAVIAPADTGAAPIDPPPAPNPGVSTDTPPASPPVA